MNIEIEILSNIVDSGDLREAKQVGITADFFRTSLGQDVWNWIITESTKPDICGEIPDSVRLGRQFPDFNFRPTKNSLKALYIEAKNTYLDKDTNALVDELQTMLEDGFDAKTVILEGIDKLKDLQASEIEKDGQFITDAASELKARYELRKTTDGITGIHYPWDIMNAMTGGMSPGQLIYIYGRPGMMKSWLLSVIAANTTRFNKRVMLYTKEIDDLTLMERVASIMLELDYSAFRAGQLPPAQEDAFYDFIDNCTKEDSGKGPYDGLFFVTDKGCKTPRTPDQLMAIAERLNPDVVFIDGFYLLNPGRLNAKKSNHEKIAAISKKLKGYAQSLNIPIICTSQANRDGKKNTNIGATEDAAFSDAVGQDADAMFRCYKGPHPTVHKGNSLLIVPKKIREGGAEGRPRPFVINANPSYDWTLQSDKVDSDRFIAEADEYYKTGGNSIGRQPGAKTTPFKKIKRKKGPFRE